MMNYYRDDEPHNNAQSRVSEEHGSDVHKGLYLAFAGFILQSLLSTLTSVLSYAGRKPLFVSVVLLISGGIFAFSSGLLNLPFAAVGVESDPTETTTELIEDPAEEIVNPAIAALEREEALREAGFVEDAEILELIVSGDTLVGSPLVFSLPPALQGETFELDLGNGIHRTIKDKVVYRYPKPGIFLVQLTPEVEGKKSAARAVVEVNKAPDSITLAENEGVAETEATEKNLIAEIDPVVEAPLPTTGTVETQVFDQMDTATRSTEEAIPAAVSEPAASPKPLIITDETAAPTKPLSFSEVPPAYPGGKDKMIQFLNEQIQYPQLARENEIEGKVYTQFVVNVDGSLSNLKVVRGIGYGCDEEALRIIRLMPQWLPGLHHGRSVPVIYTLPVNFDFSR